MSLQVLAFNRFFILHTTRLPITTHSLSYSAVLEVTQNKLLHSEDRNLRLAEETEALTNELNQARIDLKNLRLELNVANEASQKNLLLNTMKTQDAELKRCHQHIAELQASLVLSTEKNRMYLSKLEELQ